MKISRLSNARAVPPGENPDEQLELGESGLLGPVKKIIVGEQYTDNR